MAAAKLDEIRADHIGSLTRPQALLEARAKFGNREISEEQLHAVEDAEINAVIARQEKIGFPVVSDGEFSRSGFQDSFGAAVSGYDVPEDYSYYWTRGGGGSPRSTRAERVESGLEIPGAPVSTRGRVLERLKLVTNPILDEYRSAAKFAHRPVKVTLISPDRVAQRFSHEKCRDVYDGLDDFTAHVAAIEHEMMQQVVDAGCPYIQIDAPGYTAYVDPPSMERMRTRGEDPDENLARGIRADNAVIEGFPGVTFGIHLCRGNSRTIDSQTGKMLPQWHRVGHYDAIAERLYTGLNHKRFLLEYDSDRAGSFESLRFVPKGKIVVLGLVTTKSTDVESVDFLKRRIEEASQYIPVEQLALSPQCGFASGASATFPEEIQWRKLEAIMETTAQVWG